MGCLPLTFKMAQKPANLFSIFAFEAQEHSCHGGLGDDREKANLREEQFAKPKFSHSR